MEGWIKLHRSVLEHWVFEEKPYTKGQAWIYLLCIVNHSESKTLFNGKLITVNAGERITSLRQLAEQFGWSINRVKRFLELLKSDKMIDYKTEHAYTLVKVLNYAEFQANDLPKRNTNGTRTERRRNTNGTQTETNNNDKNDKNEKNVITSERARTPFLKNCPDVLLTEDQADKLLEQLSLDEFHTYCENLQEYIADGHKVHNCYQTILAWARRDREC